MSQIIKTVCARDCPDACFMQAFIENGKIVRVKGDATHPLTAGFLCPRGLADPLRVYSPERVLFAHTRTHQKPGFYFQQVALPTAIEQVASRLADTVHRFGAEAVLYLDYAGNTGLLTSGYSQRLWNALGATRTDHALCSSSGHAALGLHYGLSYGLPPEELLQQKLIIFWGFNARVSANHLWALARRARKENGAKIVVIDSRQSESAETADLWLSPYPGTDLALAFGLAQYFIENNRIHSEFIEQWTRGFSEFRETVAPWTLPQVAETTGIPLKSIELLAQYCGHRRPAAFMIGIGLQKNQAGAEIVRGVSLLPALLGYHRGFYYTNSRGRLVNWGYLTGETLTPKSPKIVSQVALAEQLAAGKFKYIFIQGMNPAHTLPHQEQVRAGLTRPDTFVVVLDTHRTTSADYADVLLPAATFFEKEDLILGDSHPYVRLSQRCIPPRADSQTEVWYTQALATALHLKEKWLFEDPLAAAQKTLENAFQAGAFEDLLNGSTLTLKSRPRHEYQTPSGKIEFYSQNALEQGFQPIPQFDPPVRKTDEFILLNSGVPKYLHTQFQEVYGPIPAIVWIALRDARRLQIQAGEIIEIYNQNGAVTARAQITTKIKAGLLWVPKLMTGLNQQPLNVLTAAKPQKIGAGPVFNSTLVKIRKVGNGGESGK